MEMPKLMHVEFDEKRKSPDVGPRSDHDSITILMNHKCTSSRELSTYYLRILDVPVPSIYGPSADENPFV